MRLCVEWLPLATEVRQAGLAPVGNGVSTTALRTPVLACSVPPEIELSW